MTPRPPAGVIAAVATTVEVLGRADLSPDMLAPWEHERLARVRVADRRDEVLAARLLLRDRVAAFLGCEPLDVVVAQHCDACGLPHYGRPRLPAHPDVGISLSHAAGLVAAAVGPGPVGIDVEPWWRTPPTPAGFARRFPGRTAALDRAESLSGTVHPGRAMLRLWVEAEASFKAGDEAGTPGLAVESWVDDDRGALVAVAAHPERLSGRWGSRGR